MSDALVISYVPGYQFTAGEVVTIAKLNLLARPTINLAGTIGTTLITDNSITTVKLVDGVLSADTAGRAKMADGYFDASATSRNKFAAGFFGAGDAQSLALFADGFWTADAAGRGKFAPGFFDGTLVSGTAAPVIGSTRNLVMKNNSGTPNTEVDIAADAVVLQNSDGAPYVAGAVSVTVDLGASGANGLDTGSPAVSAWYYVYLIYNGTTVAGLFSTSATAPTLPSGYTFVTLIGVVRTDASTHFWNFWQNDRDVFINDTVVFTAKTGVTSWTAVSGADLTALQALVPPIAKLGFGNAGNTSNDSPIAIGSDGNGLGAQVIAAQHGPNPVLSYALGGAWRVPLKTAQTVYYIMGSTSAGFRLSVSGFRI